MSKRVFDVLASAAGLLLLSPLLCIIALGVKITSPGPILYRARRVGRGGSLFTLYKFRSMVDSADQRGLKITAAGDRRVTRIGRVLRKTKLDELPQLLNVVRGDMSLVGPRPEDPRYVALYTPEQCAVLTVRPGITSLASITYRHEEAILAGADAETRYVQDVMPAKLALDLPYIRQPTVSGDIAIILRTLVAIVKPAA